ncbi:hypothetical protein [Streptomyces sp. NPDC059783]|uniref:hypothetical protein n=1 Tax=Streptomyces sp. NPDC059783 TaxID=3346944 RepID=UPI0036603191
MTLCPLGHDHPLSFDHEGEAYCEEHKIRLQWHPAPATPPEPGTSPRTAPDTAPDA